jgi:hypothetical protein
MELIRNLLNLNNRNFRSVEKFRLVENRLKAHFHSGKFCKIWLLADANFPSEKNFEVENFQLLHLTIGYFRKFSSVEIGLCCRELPELTSWHCLIIHDCLSTPGPPNFFMSLQYLHSSQSSRVHASHARHLTRRRRNDELGFRGLRSDLVFLACKKIILDNLIH